MKNPVNVQHEKGQPYLSIIRLLPAIPLWLFALVSLTFLIIIGVQIVRGSPVSLWGCKFNENTPLPKRNGRIVVAGKHEKTADEQWIFFPKGAFTSAPVVIITPDSEQEGAALTVHPDIIKKITPEKFLVRSDNVGSQYYIDWIAVEGE